MADAASVLGQTKFGANQSSFMRRGWPARTGRPWRAQMLRHLVVLPLPLLERDERHPVRLHEGCPFFSLGRRPKTRAACSSSLTAFGRRARRSNSAFFRVG